MARPVRYCRPLPGRFGKATQVRRLLYVTALYVKLENLSIRKSLLPKTVTKKPATLSVHLRIEELIEERGTTAYRLALDTGIGHTALWKLRHGKQPSIKLEYIGKLCEVLNCTPNDLIAIDQKPPSAKRKA